MILNNYHLLYISLILSLFIIILLAILFLELHFVLLRRSRET